MAKDLLKPSRWLYIWRITEIQGNNEWTTAIITAPDAETARELAPATTVSNSHRRALKIGEAYANCEFAQVLLAVV